MKSMLVAVLALMLTAGSAHAGNIPPGGLTIDEVAAWLQGAGYKTAIVQASNGVRHVHAIGAGSDFSVYMWNCTAGRCGAIQFAAGFATHGHFDTSRMNQWNRDNRWARGYFDATNDPWLEMDVDLDPGGTYELLADELATWIGTLKHFVGLYGL